DEQGRTDFAGVMACMCTHYGSDKGAKDISRVLRMPGFLHRKNPEEPYMVRVVGGNRRRYTRAQITAAFPAPEKARAHGHAGTGDSEAHAELVRQVLTGENYHGALTALAWRQIGAGMPAGQVVEKTARHYAQHPQRAPRRALAGTLRRDPQLGQQRLGKAGG